LTTFPNTVHHPNVVQTDEKIGFFLIDYFGDAWDTKTISAIYVCSGVYFIRM